MSIIQKLHDSEINASIQSFYDRCWTARLGDEMNGFAAEETGLESFEECERWLDVAAKSLCPDSAYAKS